MKKEASREAMLAGCGRAFHVIQSRMQVYTTAKQIIEAWRREYNDSRPHRSLGERTPSEFTWQIALNGDLPSSQAAENSP